MAEIDPQLQTVLLAATSLTAIVSTRIYNDELPQKPTYPCIVYTVFIDEIDTLENNSDVAMVQFDILGSTKTQCINIRQPLRDALENTTAFIALFSDHQSKTPEDDINASREIMTYKVWYDR